MKRSRMQQMSMEVTVGAFMFMVLMALGVFTIILSGENIFTEKYEVEIVFEDVMQLREGDRVTMRGFEIGKISQLGLTQDMVRVVARIDRPLIFREEYKASILASTVLGGRYLELDEGPKENTPIPLGTVLVGTEPTDILVQAQETMDEVTTSLVTNMTKFGELASDLQGALNVLEPGHDGLLAAVLHDPGLRDDILATVRSASNIAADLEGEDGALGKMLIGEESFTDLQTALSNLETVLASLDEGDGVLGKMLIGDEGLAELQAALAAFGQVGEGKGTIGRLLADETLYDEVRLLVFEVRAAVDDFRETAPITLFTSIFFGAF